MTSSINNNTMATSTSTFRTSHTQPVASNTMSYSDNPITKLPVVDFNFEDLRKRMADFTVKFDAFIEQSRKQVLEERNEFRGRLGEIHEEKRSTNTQISTLSSSLTTHHTLQSREASEKTEMQSQIQDLEIRQSKQSAHRDRLRSAIAHTQRQIDAKLQAQREYADKMDSQARLNGPELNFWETYLGCRIEGAGDENLVKVVFAFPPGRAAKDQGEREASFELKVPESGSAGYEVVFCRPRLVDERVRSVVDRLNETRDIAVLLKGMRALFAEELK